ncbi:MAG: cytochrome C oxidase subunit IV family protein [Planctomycetota bacterium]
MAHHTHAEGEAHPEVGHVVPVRYLVGAGLALIVLTAITVASHSVDMGEANLPVALAIAMVKATIVALIFMHLRWDRPFNLLVLVGSALFVLLMLAFAGMDVHQYEPTMFNGNPAQVEQTLQANAPGAPVAQVKSTNGGGT